MLDVIEEILSLFSFYTLFLAIPIDPEPIDRRLRPEPYILATARQVQEPDVEQLQSQIELRGVCDSFRQRKPLPDTLLNDGLFCRPLFKEIQQDRR